MTSTSLHPTPSTRNVAVEQFRAVGLALRTETYFFLAALSLIGVLVVSSTIREMHLHPGSGVDHSFTYGSMGAIPVLLMALLIPFGVWRAEDPSRRAYLWTMPVARGPQTVIKLLSGWGWLMLAGVVYALFIILLATINSMITGGPNVVASGPGWEWMVIFSATTLGYLLTSVAVIGSDHAWRWIGGLVLGYWVLMGVFASFGMQDAGLALRTIWDGVYGLKAALFGTGPDAYVNGASRMMMRETLESHWLVAMPLWIIGAGIATAIASYRHRE